MGQSQSSSDGATAQDKADYYELLGVEHQATDEEIKKAYRRKALELHPDRNYGDVERATELFAEIQTAYEVLADPQERAWYDSHRDVLLRGGQPGQTTTQEEFSYNIRMTSVDDVLKLMMKYNGRLDFGNSVAGFYGGLREFFGQLAKEEEIACRWEDTDPVDYPDFGQKDDDYNEVVRPFYASWNGFATRKSYSWKDRYRLSEASDRRVRRLMEKENKALRDDAIREFNDAVRSLVAFVRKRDPRYQENQKSEEERQKILRDAAATQSARSLAARKARLDELDRQIVPDWAKSTRVDDELEGGFSSGEDSEQYEVECVVCQKTFKSEAQYEAHERSKKHIKLAKQLRREMKAEDQELGDIDVNGHIDEPSQVPDLNGKDAEIGGGHTAAQTDPDKGSDNDVRPTKENSSQQRENGLVNDAESPDNRSSDEAFDEVEGRLLRPEIEDLTKQVNATTIHAETPAASETDTPAALPKLGKAKQKRAKKAMRKDDEKKSSTYAGFKCVVCGGEFASKTKLFGHINEKGHAAPVAGTGSKGIKSSRGKR